MAKTIDKIDKHRQICAGLTALYINKNHDYGDSFGESFHKLGIISAVTRLSDKMNRLTSLATRPQDQRVMDEKIEDTLRDMANYAIMTLIELGVARELDDEEEDDEELECMNCKHFTEPEVAYAMDGSKCAEVCTKCKYTALSHTKEYETRPILWEAE